MIAGITGRVCAGKNHIASLLQARGWQILDVDKLGHQAIELKKTEILERFGSECLGSNGSVDRRALASLVFGHPEKLQELQDIVHPEANRLSEQWVTERKGGKLLINAALLHHSTLYPQLDFVILVRAPFLVRLYRALLRDKLPLHTLLARFKRQKHFEAQYFSRNADIYTVYNPGSLCFGRRFSAFLLNRRLDSILAREGMDR